MESVWLCPTVVEEGCQWQGRPGEIVPHFQDVHNTLLLHSTTFPVDLAVNRNENKILCLENKVYLVQVSVLLIEGLLKIKLRYLGTQNDASAFDYTVHVCVGNFAFKCLPDEPCNTVYVKDGGVEVDLQLINLTCGTHILSSVICVLNISNKRSVPFETRNLNNDTKQDSEPVEAVNENVDQNNESVVIVETPTLRNNEPVVETPVLRNNESVVESPILRKGVVSRNNSTEKSNNKKIRHRNSFLENFFFDDLSLNALTDSSSAHSQRTDGTSPENPELVCATCSSEMYPPIFLCSGGHSVCNVCRSTKCRKCNQDITDIRNTDLEDISLRLQHPCKYASYGCCERGIYEEIRVHEVNCRFCTYKCSLCPSIGKFSDMKSHFKLFHSSVKVHETLRNNFPRNTTFAIVSNEDGIFYCSSHLTGSNIDWSVTFCGPKERWFSCELRIKGKKEELSYFLKRSSNTYQLTLSLSDLKASGVKDKNAVLIISS